MKEIPKVLIVDDDPGMCRSMKALLCNNGCALETSHAGKDAIGRMDKVFFDLVLLDLFIPDMNGFRILEHINRTSPDTLVIIITGNSSEKTAIEAIRKGAHDYIKKPFEPEKLIKTVGNCLDQRKLMRERSQIMEALRENEQKLEAIFRASPVGISLVINRKIDWSNETLNRLLGYEKDDLLGQNARILYRSDDEYIRVGRKLYARSETALVETQLERKDKTRFDCMLCSCPLDAADLSKGYIVAVNDISESKRLAAQLQRAQKMEIMGNLAGGVAHDLNNILSGLVSYPELLLMQMPEDDPLRKPLTTIQKSGEKAAAVVEDLLTLARRGVAVTEVVDLNEIIFQYLKSPEYEKLTSFHPNVELFTHLEAEILNILVSPTHVSKAVMNLIVNATEAIPAGGRIVVKTENRYIDKPVSGYEEVVEGDYAVLTVSDTGVGILPEDIQRVFEPFYTKKKMGRSGTGLGMAVVWNTVKDHKGYIDVQSTEGKGCTFTLYFPATRKEKREGETTLSLENYKGNGESILIVDDVEEQRQIASGMLKELGYSVVSASSGEKAVEYLKTHEVDLLVLDMIMDPGMDGLDTYKLILDRHPGQKAIIASGFSETERVKALQRLGGGPYIRKPFLLKKIAFAVKEELKKPVFDDRVFNEVPGRAKQVQSQRLATDL